MVKKINSQKILCYNRVCAQMIFKNFLYQSKNFRKISRSNRTRRAIDILWLKSDYNFKWSGTRKKIQSNQGKIYKLNKFSSIFPKLGLLLYKLNILFRLKDFTHEDKIREDTSLWKTWLKKYLNRIYDESKNIENHEKHRLSLMNSANPRLKIKISLVPILNAYKSIFKIILDSYYVII
jgi:hypothetical protein